MKDSLIEPGSPFAPPEVPAALREFARTAECSVIVACFNEAGTIAELIGRTRAVLPRAEIVVVYGGNDRTAEIAEEIGRADRLVRTVRNRPDYGKGHASKVGILAAAHDLQGTIDADLQFAPEDLPALLHPVARGECVLAHASRFRGGDWSAEAKDPLRDLGNAFLSRLVSALTGTRVTDVTAGFHAWSRRHLLQVWFDDDRFSFDLELIIRTLAGGYPLREVPVRYRHRQAGESMHRSPAAVVRAGFEMLRVILSTWFQARVLGRIRASSYPRVSPRPAATAVAAP
jgi:glycosyltransferase involved in cell wall biosynthesis